MNTGTENMLTMSKLDTAHIYNYWSLNNRK